MDISKLKVEIYDLIQESAHVTQKSRAIGVDT